MSDNAAKIEVHIANLEEQKSKASDYLNRTVVAIAQLEEEKKKTTNQIIELGGALTAYKDSLNLIKPPVEEVPAVVDVTPAMVESAS
jgi:hypothetical protein